MPKILPLLGILASVIIPLTAADNQSNAAVQTPVKVAAGQADRPAATEPRLTPAGLSRKGRQPVKIRIAGIGLEAPVVPVGVGEDRLVAVPEQAVGWWEKSSCPGAAGPVVLQGHWQKSGRITGVFSRLAEVETGDRIELEDGSGSEYAYRVTETKSVKTEEFPTKEFYGSAGGGRLHLVTCAGRYDAKRGTYTERTIVYAEAVY